MTEFKNKLVTDQDLLRMGLPEIDTEPVGGNWHIGKQRFFPKVHQSQIRNDFLTETGGEDDEVYFFGERPANHQQAPQAHEIQRLPRIHTVTHGVTWKSLTRKR